MTFARNLITFRKYFDRHCGPRKLNILCSPGHKFAREVFSLSLLHLRPIVCYYCVIRAIGSSLGLEGDGGLKLRAEDNS